MYESFFNLRIKPFDLVPDPNFMFLSKSHKKALTYLDYGIRERAGFILLTGEVGSGKTTMIRNVFDKHYDHVILAKIFNTCVTSEQLLAMINDDFGLPSTGKDKISLIRDLNGFLVEQYAQGNQPILIIDEAQNLAPELLEEVRMLSNLETSDSKLLQIVLVGQPELRTILAAPELRQLRQRISINCHLQALDRQDVELYIRHRLQVAGDASAAGFSADILDFICQYSKGIPRLINIICDFLLLSAFAEESKTISIEMVHDVIGDLDFDNYFWSAATAAQECPPAAASAPAVSEPQAQSQAAVYKLVQDICRRIESIEKELTVPAQTFSSDINERLEMNQKAIDMHVSKTNLQLMDLNQKLEEVLRAIPKGDPQPALKDPPRPGFLRRFFGGDDVGTRKG